MSYRTSHALHVLCIITMASVLAGNAGEVDDWPNTHPIPSNWPTRDKLQHDFVRTRIGLLTRDGPFEKRGGSPYARPIEVVKVIPGSPADKAGIAAGDVILSWIGDLGNGKKMGRDRPFRGAGDFGYCVDSAIIHSLKFAVRIRRRGNDVACTFDLDPLEGKGIVWRPGYHDDHIHAYDREEYFENLKFVCLMRSLLGIRTSDDEQRNNWGRGPATMTDVLEGGAADKAGLHDGDSLVMFDRIYHHGRWGTGGILEFTRGFLSPGRILNQLYDARAAGHVGSASLGQGTGSFGFVVLRKAESKKSRADFDIDDSIPLRLTESRRSSELVFDIPASAGSSIGPQDKALSRFLASYHDLLSRESRQLSKEEQHQVRRAFRALLKDIERWIPGSGTANADPRGVLFATRLAFLAAARSNTDWRSRLDRYLARSRAARGDRGFSQGIVRELLSLSSSPTQYKLGVTTPRPMDPEAALILQRFQSRLDAYQRVENELEFVRHLGKCFLLHEQCDRYLRNNRALSLATQQGWLCVRQIQIVLRSRWIQGSGARINPYGIVLTEQSPREDLPRDAEIARYVVERQLDSMAAPEEKAETLYAAVQYFNAYVPPCWAVKREMLAYAERYLAGKPKGPRRLPALAARLSFLSAVGQLRDREIERVWQEYLATEDGHQKEAFAYYCVAALKTLRTREPEKRMALRRRMKTVYDEVEDPGIRLLLLAP